MKNGCDGELQRAAVAEKSGGGGGELERDRGEFNHSVTLVTVLAAVTGMYVHVHAAASSQEDS